MLAEVRGEAGPERTRSVAGREPQGGALYSESRTLCSEVGAWVPGRPGSALLGTRQGTPQIPSVLPPPPPSRSKLCPLGAQGTFAEIRRRSWPRLWVSRGSLLTRVRQEMPGRQQPGCMHPLPAAFSLACSHPVESFMLLRSSSNPLLEFSGGEGMRSHTSQSTVFHGCF